jgi:deleted-in-malignant-brain-tumors protein 1
MFAYKNTMHPYNDIVICEYGDIRLVDGTTELEGRVELCINETWGTVCDGFWSTFDTNVACRQLGYQPSMSTPLYNAAFGPGTGPIWIDDLLCRNTEQRLIDCPHGGILNTDFCNGHNDDAGVRCLEGTPIPFNSTY